MRQDCILDFCVHTALSWNSLIQNVSGVDRTFFFFNEAKQVAKKTKEPAVAEMCEVLQRLPEKADWIFDQFFWSTCGVASSPDCHPKDNVFLKAMRQMDGGLEPKVNVNRNKLKRQRKRAA